MILGPTRTSNSWNMAGSMRRNDTKSPCDSRWSSSIRVSYWPNSLRRWIHGRTHQRRLLVFRFWRGHTTVPKIALSRSSASSSCSCSCNHLSLCGSIGGILMLCILQKNFEWAHIPRVWPWYTPFKNPYVHSLPWPGTARATYDDRTGVLKHLWVRTVLAHAPYGPVHTPYGNRTGYCDPFAKTS